MIENYLSWVKGQRSASLKVGRGCLKRSRESTDDWLRGYFKGWSSASKIEAQSWRQLQKDIEHRNSLGHVVADIGNFSHRVYSKLS